MNRIKRRIKQAAKRGVYVFRADELTTLCCIATDDDLRYGYLSSQRLTRRQAAARAYSISVSKKPKVVFETINEPTWTYREEMIEFIDRTTLADSFQRNFVARC